MSKVPTPTQFKIYLYNIGEITKIADFKNAWQDGTKCCNHLNSLIAGYSPYLFYFVTYKFSGSLCRSICVEENLRTKEEERIQIKLHEIPVARIK